MFIYLDAFDPGQINGFPGISHRKRQCRQFFIIHALKTDCHQHRRHLIIRNLSRHILPDHSQDLPGLQRLPFLFSVDQIHKPSCSCLHPPVTSFWFYADHTVIGNHNMSGEVCTDSEKFFDLIQVPYFIIKDYPHGI